MTFKELKDIVVDIMGMPEDEVEQSSHLYDDLDADSLDMSQIILAVENSFNVEVEQEDISKFQTINDIIEHVNSLV